MRGSLFSFSVALAVAIITAAVSFGQCPGGICPPGVPGVRVVDGPLKVVNYSWHQRADEPHRWYLYRGGRQVGGYDAQTHTYRTLLDYTQGVWSSSAPCPAPLPAKARLYRAKPVKAPVPRPVEEEIPPVNFGVDVDKLNQSPPGHYINGKKATRKQAINAIKQGALQDDSTKSRIVVIAGEADRAKMQSAFAAEPALKDLGKKYIVQFFGPEDWQVKDRGFELEAGRTVYFQDSAGKVLARGAEAFDLEPQAFAGRILKRDPSYRPLNDPRWTDPLNPLSWLGTDHVPGVCLAVAVIALLLVPGKRS